MKQWNRHDRLRIETLLLAILLLGGGLVWSANGADMEVTRDMRYSEDFGERAPAALVEMSRELARRGCKTGLAYAYSKEDAPGVLVLAIRCVEGAMQVKQ